MLCLKGKTLRNFFWQGECSMELATFVQEFYFSTVSDFIDIPLHLQTVRLIDRIIRTEGTRREYNIIELGTFTEFS